MNRVRGVNTCTNTRRRGARVKPWRAVAALLHSPGPMTTSVHDLGKLRLDRDTPPGVRRAFRRSLILAAVAAGLIAAVVLVVRRGSAVPVQTVVVRPLEAGAGAAGGARAVRRTATGAGGTGGRGPSKVRGGLAYLVGAGGSAWRSGAVLGGLDTGDLEGQARQATP